MVADMMIRRMNPSNLPPGVSDRDLPGNSPEDERFEKLFDAILASGLSADDARRRWESQPKLLSTLTKTVSLHAPHNLVERRIEKEAKEVIEAAEGPKCIEPKLAAPPCP